MTARVTLSVLGRVGWAHQLSQIEVHGRDARETILRLRTRSAGPPSILSAAERSIPTTSVIDEILRLLPPRPEFAGCDAQAIRVPWEAFAAFGTGADGVTASYAKSMLGWSAIPECVSSLHERVYAEFFVITGGPAGETVRWWVSGDAGWVALALDAGEVSVVPSSIADIRFSLLVDLIGAITARPA